MGSTARMGITQEIANEIEDDTIEMTQSEGERKWTEALAPEPQGYAKTSNICHQRPRRGKRLRLKRS